MQVENIGDIDRDGFEDLAVSAPYEDNGVVYIYRGIQEGFSKEFQVRGDDPVFNKVATCACFCRLSREV